MSDIEKLLRESGAVLEGHFLLTSGRHSDVYVEKFRLLENPEMVEKVGIMLVEPYKHQNVDMVAGAAVGGILLSYSAAKCLGTKGIFAERVNGSLKFKRGFELPENGNVLIVEDIITTGGSVLELIDLVKKSGSEPVGVSCIVYRSQDDVDFGVPINTLWRFPAVSWEPDECPLCERGESLTSRGRTGK